jgi:hypothetical protein
MAVLAGISLAAAEPEFHGAGWVSFGLIEKSTTATGAPVDFDKNWLGHSGAVINTGSQVNENWNAGFGMGTALVHLARGSISGAQLWYPFWVGFVTEARLTYSSLDFAESGGIQLNLGAFGYDYQPSSKNLGRYLLRGYIYPNALVSGAGNIFGSALTYKTGAFSNDFILSVETEDKPLYDISIADIATFKIGEGLEIGAGVNFYRAIAQDEAATRPGKDCIESDLSVYAKQDQPNPCFYIKTDSAGAPIDTITIPLSGTKMMARFKADFKTLFGIESGLGANDLVLYGEAAVLGLANYEGYYDDILRRIPVMVGFNFPGFGYLDASIEIEYFANKNSFDNLGPQNGSPLPSLKDKFNSARDDWKWSLNLARMIGNHMQLTGVIANDHLRLGGSHNTATGLEAVRAPTDWYWSSKLAFFF